MTGLFRIHGLELELISNHPLLFRTFAQDLEHFRTPRTTRSAEKVRLRLTALPRLSEANGYPVDFARYREIQPQQMNRPGETVTRFGMSLVTVITDLQRKQIRAAILPEGRLLPDPAYHLCFTQPISLWLKQRSLFFLHAGCVAEGSAGVLIIGHSRAGKSCLSLSAVRDGFRFLSDEQPLIQKRAGSVAALAFPRRIRLDRAVASGFPELKGLLRATGCERILFPIERVWPGSVTESCLPRLLVFPKFQAHGKLKVRQLHPTQALARLLQDDHFIWYRRGPLSRLSEEHLSVLEGLAKQAEPVEMLYGNSDLQRIPPAFRRLLRG